MPDAFLALITPLTGNGVPTHPIVTPPPYPDQGLPPGSPGSPAHPIFIPGAPPGTPGHPAHPIYITGNPSHPIHVPGVPSHPWLPGGSPSHPIAGFPDQGLPGGQPVPPGTIDPGPVPPELANQLIVAVHRPGQEWVVKSYTVAPDQGLPQPQPV
jgi:hypothetical protein